MTFRIEKKIFVSLANIAKFYKLLNEKFAVELHPERKIYSIYFDNEKFDMYNDSEEGLVPRKKIRIRSYDNFTSNQKYLEMKISSSEGRFKTNKLIDDKLFNKFIGKGYFDLNYGLCRPRLIVSYLRSYYKVKSFRLTIDKKIYFKKFTNLNKLNSNFQVNIDKFVVEIKSRIQDGIKEKILEEFPFNDLRISKYCDAVKKLKLF